jgi:hypothetical protein
LKTFYFSIPKLPDIGFGGHLKATTLAAWRPLGPNAYLFPDATYSRDFVVVIPDRTVQAIDARAKIIYARAARLTPGTPYSSGLKHYPGCSSSEQFAYYIDQSALSLFTNGNLVFITNWCADIAHPDVSVLITKVPDTTESTTTESALVSHYGVVGNTAIATFAVPPAANARP